MKKQHDSETQAVGQQVITACAFIYHAFDDVTKVFLPKRAHSKRFLPGVYELPGGHIEFGEEIVAGLQREIVEEFNKELIVGDSFAVFTYMNEVKGAHAIEVIYFAQFDGDIDDIILNPEDHETYDWFSEADIAKKITPTKGKEDPEIQAIYKGFSLLRNGKTSRH